MTTYLVLGNLDHPLLRMLGAELRLFCPLLAKSRPSTAPSVAACLPVEVHHSLQSMLATEFRLGPGQPINWRGWTAWSTARSTLTHAFRSLLSNLQQRAEDAPRVPFGSAIPKTNRVMGAEVVRDGGEVARAFSVSKPEKVVH